MIETQVNILLRFVLEDDRGNITYGPYIKGPKMIKPIIQFIALVIYLMVVMFFGLYLWNQGLHVAFPGVVMQLGTTTYRQLPNPYVQLLVTLVAMMFIL